MDGARDGFGWRFNSESGYLWRESISGKLREKVVEGRFEVAWEEVNCLWKGKMKRWKCISAARPLQALALAVTRRARRCQFAR